MVKINYLSMYYQIWNKAGITVSNKFLLFLQYVHKRTLQFLTDKQNKHNILGNSRHHQSIKEQTKFYFEWPGSYSHAANQPSILHASCNTQHITAQSGRFLSWVWKVFGFASREAHKNQRSVVSLCKDSSELHFGQLLLNVQNVPSPKCKTH